MTRGLTTGLVEARDFASGTSSRSSKLIHWGVQRVVPLRYRQKTLGLAERFLPMRQGYEYLLRNALSNLPAYDFVILDCPPSLGAVTYNALTAANRVIAPTQPEYFSAYGLRSVMAAIRRVRGTGGQAGQAYTMPMNTMLNPATTIMSMRSW